MRFELLDDDMLSCDVF